MTTGFILLLSQFFLACTQKETPNFEDFQAEYFNARQDDLADACSSWYEDCIAEGYPEDACSTRLEECSNDENREEDPQGSEGGSSECDEATRTAYAECLEDGGTEEECREAAAQAYEECINNSEE